ncbi:MAG: DNA-directed RNA polymerase subunit alpha [Simkaniaceae bacterium]
MAVRYGKFELPLQIKIDEKDKTENFVRFIAEPFERGYGHTVGNSLRRIMLTSIEAPAVMSIKIEGVPHEYMAVEGIIEDMTHVILNFKKALFRKLPTDDEKESKSTKTVSKLLEVTPEMIEENGGQYVVRLKDVVGDSDFELVNPELAIFTVTKPLAKKIDIKVGFGRGYVPAEKHDSSQLAVDEILVDSAYSPIRLVNYFVENTRVGQATDYDRLVLEVTTDGRITPQEALTFASQIAIMHFKGFEATESFLPITIEQEKEEEDTDKDAILAKLALKINEIELSVRSTNCLAQANIDTIAELVIMPESEMLRFRNFGKKSLNEIKAKLEDMGLHLGMDLSKYGITRDNVKTVISDYINEKVGKEA